jgi:hypothetical protein
MNRAWTLGVVLAVAFSAVACDDDNPVTPTPSGQTLFTAQLLPGNEVPPVTNADASASGAMSLTLNVVRDSAQQITSATGDFTVRMIGFPAPTTLTGAHIHGGRAGVNAGIVVNLQIAGAETQLASGSGTITRTGQTIDPVVAQNMINDPAAFYFNVHTTLNTGGAIRSQLVKQ